MLSSIIVLVDHGGTSSLDMNEKHRICQYAGPQHFPFSSSCNRFQSFFFYLDGLDLGLGQLRVAVAVGELSKVQDGS